MLVKFNTVEGAAAGKDHQLCISTQDAVDMPLLQELFAHVPLCIKANLNVERQGGYSCGSLFLTWGTGT